MILFTNSETISRGPLTIRTLRGFRNRHSQRAALLAAGADDAALDGLFAALAAEHRTWDLLRLEGIPAEDGLQERLLAAAARNGCAGLVTRRFTQHRVAMNQSWSAYYGATRKKKRREQERLVRRLVDLAGALEWTKFRGADAVKHGLEIYLRIEQESWKAADSDGEVILDDPVLTAFYRSVAERFAARDRLEVDVVSAGGKPIAALYSLLFEGRLVALKTSFDERFARFSPGWILFHYLLREGFERPLREVDFYGNRDVLNFWTKDLVPYADLLIFSPSGRGRILATTKRWMMRIQRERT